MGGISNSMDMSLNKLREIVKDREALMLQYIGSQRVGQDLVSKQQQLSLVVANACGGC